MKIRSQVGMVLNLDKCIGCHTCSVTCKNVWTGREGMEYAWFNNVETKPGIGYPKNWEDQEEWQGGWVRDVNGKIRPRLGSKMGVITKIFANPVVPQIDDYYEPFTFDYEHLHSAPEGKHIPTARPRSLIDGKRMDKVIWGPNWEELLGGEFEKRARDRNFEAMQKEMYGQFENTFMMYLPRLCEHCLNPSCVATCPSGAIYKREEDGIVLIDQDKCRGWRLCISGCPYKKIYFNWKSGKSEKCIFCYPRIESGQPTVCSETCVGRIRYLGVLLYDADRIEEAASTEREVDLYERQCEVFPVVPQIDDYYEPFTFDYEHLHSAPEGKHIPTARPRSLIDGKRMDKVIWGPNWEELLGGEFEKRARDRNFEAMQKEMYGQFENTFMMYLPRLCEHCLNPSCVATCPSGAIYKREEDGIVLIDQDKCRGWRLCISGCPYKKIYFNWKSGKSEKCIFCYPRIESGQPTVCSETCVGRIRYLGVLLYDADRIEEAASTEREVDLYERQCEVFLDPHDPSVIEEALKQGIPQNVIEAAQRSPVYKMAMDWKLALPLHPEYRTLPMVWYVPPLSPIQSYADAGGLPKSEGVLPAIESLRIPVQYLANMLSAGDTGPVLRALKRMMAMRHYMRSQTVEGVTDTRAIDEVGLSVAQVEEMYRYLAIANYEDRFVIPTSHREMAGDAFAERNGCGFTFGDGCHGSDSKFNLFNSSRIDAINITEVRDKAEGE